MSNNRNNDLDAAAGCGFLIFGGLAFLGYWIWEQFQTPLKTQLVELNTNSSWGTIVQSLDCVNCGKPQDSFHKECIHCGQRLALTEKKESGNATSESLGYQFSKGEIISIVIIVLVAIFLMILTNI